ncbi:MAG: ABC transporter ATP-binding protein [Thermoleophilia bacterium]|nr:ABC transporter ATP-binding protein [Thermoleophilia bacterium]
MSAQVRLSLEGVTHRFGKVTALDSVNLAIEEGELVTLLGPSGCGKTTLLRIIAGFVLPTEGRVVVEGQDVTRVPPHKRPVNMVFQRAALFPHLDVRANIAFGLQVAGIRGAEADERIAEALRLVRLEGYEQRRAHELSGGQMQRVALARALVNRPRVLLLDEPLSALDLKIRLEMEVELRRLHRETGATFVYVTHDQREALALSDRIVVFNNGQIEQVGAPDEIYHEPASPFAARFVGDANVVAAKVVSIEGGSATVTVGSHRLAVPSGSDVPVGDAWLVLRPEVVRVSAAGSDGLPGTVLDAAFRGTGHSYRIAVDGIADPMKAEMAAEHGKPFAVGDTVFVQWASSACRLIPAGASSVADAPTVEGVAR